ncbi:hypothetical protein AM1BK_42990 [Neobacillus kokaensis]|uniref:Uncharacterized protein n=1 Tax=Neobacillus kokaensis TaxID=2759023 RepID=A0ABQ3N970_9BACI|nr:hypothetical protein AM1BK_42990 [Neobacillus kokaensis]
MALKRVRPVFFFRDTFKRCLLILRKGTVYHKQHKGAGTLEIRSKMQCRRL